MGEKCLLRYGIIRIEADLKGPLFIRIATNFVCKLYDELTEVIVIQYTDNHASSFHFLVQISWVENFNLFNYMMN